LQGEFWKTAQDFEKELRAEKKGTDMEKLLLVNENMRRIDEIKQKTSYYVEALEVTATLVLVGCAYAD